MSLPFQYLCHPVLQTSVLCRNTNFDLIYKEQRLDSS